MKAFFSMTFVFFYLNVHLQSCFLSCVGLAIIMLSFPFTALITNGIFQIKYFGTKPKNLVDRNIIKMSDFQRFVDSMLQFRPPLVQLGNRTPETGFKSTLQGFGSFLVDFNVHKHCVAVPTESQNLSYHSWMCPFPRTRLDGDYVVPSTKVVMELDPCSGQI